MGRMTMAALLGICGGITIFILRVMVDGDLSRSAFFGVVFAIVMFVISLVLFSDRFSKSDEENRERGND